jgi:hypothetical protein
VAAEVDDDLDVVEPRHLVLGPEQDLLDHRQVGGVLDQHVPVGGQRAGAAQHERQREPDHAAEDARAGGGRRGERAQPRSPRRRADYGDDQPLEPAQHRPED